MKNKTMNAICVAGELAGVASRLDEKELEEFLPTAPRDFRYEQLCRAAIAFKRALNTAVQSPGATP